MTAVTRRKVIDHYEGFMSRNLGGARGSTTPRVLLDAAARAMLAVVLGEAEQLELPMTSPVLDNSSSGAGPSPIEPDTETP